MDWHNLFIHSYITILATKGKKRWDASDTESKRGNVEREITNDVQKPFDRHRLESELSSESG